MTILPLQDRARSVLADSVVWDNHGCMPLRADASFLPQLARYQRAGCTVVSLNVGFGESTWEDHLSVLSYMRWWISKHSDAYRLVRSVQDIRDCQVDGKLGVVFDIEGMVPVQDNPTMVRTFYDLGVRWMLIAYNRTNRAGGGCLDLDSGLTATGRTIIDEMAKVGMVLCLSHAGAVTAAEALAYNPNPSIYSHSNVAALAAHPRNISDEAIIACARRGGVIGINGIGEFLGARNDATRAFLDHVRYLIDLVGPEHVGIALDYVFDLDELQVQFAADPSLFAKQTDVSKSRLTVEPEALNQIAESLLRDNLSEEVVKGIFGGNWLRIASQVWK